MVISRIMLSATVTALLLGSVLTATFAIQSANASGTIYIRANGLIEGTTEITSADNIIYIFTGNIFESIVVERSNITVDGKGYTLWGPGSGSGFYWSDTNNVTVTNVGIEYFILGIQVANSSLNTISGNNITNNDYGIFLSSSSNNSVSGNNIANNLRGIQIHSSSNNSISGNNITANTQHGIDLDSSSNNSISGNNITANNRHGIELITGSNNSISGNNITANRHGGVSLAHSSNNSINGNNITANNRHGIELGWGSNNNSVSGNNVTANSGAGIRLYYSSNNSVSGNSFVSNGLVSEGSYGNVVSNNLVNGKPLVYLEGTSDIVVEQAGQVVLVRCNRIRVENLTLSNANVGVQLWQTNNTEILGNNVTNNGRGVWLYDSSNNSICHNNFINHPIQVSTYRSYNNTWDNGYPSGGNYWSSHNPPDIYGGPYQNETGIDGIGDIPYILVENNIDRYPLIYPYGYVPSPDVNDDAVVDVSDVDTVAEAFGSRPGDSNWNPIADLVQDEVIDIFDVVAVARNFGNTA